MARQTKKDREDEARAGRWVNRELNRKDTDRLSHKGAKRKTTKRK